MPMPTSPIDKSDPMRLARLRAGLTQEELARQAGCSLNYVRLFETGYRPKRAEQSAKFQNILQVLEINTDELAADQAVCPNCGYPLP